MTKVSNMMTNMDGSIDWTAEVKGILKAELKRRGVTYAQLIEKLGEIGVKETEVNLRNKIARGSFTAVFLLQCLRAAGVQSVTIAQRPSI